MTKTKNILLRLTTTAVMIAMSIVLCRLLGFPPTGTYRIELGFLPIAVIAMLYGPIWSGVAYGISDLIGAWIFTGINPFITLCKIAFGVVMGLFFYRREKNRTSSQYSVFSYYWCRNRYRLHVPDFCLHVRIHMGGVADNTLDCVAYQYRRTNSRLFPTFPLAWRFLTEIYEEI